MFPTPSFLDQTNTHLTVFCKDLSEDSLEIDISS